jgi:hypothetical protein
MWRHRGWGKTFASCDSEIEDRQINVEHRSPAEQPGD